MKRTMILMAVVSMVILMAVGCFGIIRGSGDLETGYFDYSDFTSIEVGNAFEVQVVQSDSFNIAITMDDNLFDYLNISMSGETLEIRLESSYSYFSYTNRVEITMPELRKLVFSGATSGMVNGFDCAQPLDIELSGAGSLEMSDMVAVDVDFEISGASSLNGSIMVKGGIRFNISGASSVILSGSADDLAADVSGASGLDLEDFPVGDVDVTFSGASNGTVNLEGTLKADLSGASHLQYIGEPIFGDLETSGASSISRK
ncbi:MAG: DUF2807 domain-containing protein [Dehalococcoidia bacterium]|nr:MAG: DUF2807 domain-containing protein [Dehalococcoidia bacterium]